MPPYPFGKGPIATAFETYVQTTERALDLLHTVWNAPMGKNARFRRSLDKDQQRHLDEVLYPEKFPPQNATAADKAELRAEGKHRREAVRNGLRGALVIALGVDPDLQHPVAADVTRDPPWPVEFFWGCGAPVDICWVSSRMQPGDPERGQVTLVLQLAANVDPPPMMTPVTARRGKPHPVRLERALYVYRGSDHGGAWASPGQALQGYVPPPSPTQAKKAAKAGKATKAAKR
jgi:hypothetical protein